MLARAPGDVAHANVAQPKTFPVARAFTPEGQCSQLRRERTRAACSAQISPRRAAGMRCAAGQLTERRAGCAADSAHIWSTRSASTVDLGPGPGRCAEPAGPRFPAFTQRPAHHGVDVLRIEPWPPPAVPFGIAVRPGAPQGPACGAGDAKRDRSRGGRGRRELVRDAPARSGGRSITEPHNPYTAAQASGSRVPSMAARATSVRRRLLLRA